MKRGRTVFTDLAGKKIPATLLLILVCCFSTQESRAQADSLIKLLSGKLSDTARVNRLNEISYAYRNSKPETAQDYADQAIRLAEKINYPKGLSTGYMNYGVAVGRNGDYVKEISWYDKALPIALELKDDALLAKIYGNLGTSYYYMGSYKNAVDYNLKSMRLYDKVGDKFGMAVDELSLGNICLQQKIFTEAKTHYLKAIEYNRASKNLLLFEAQALVNIGNIHNYKEEYDEALKYYNDAIPIFEKNNESYARTVCLNNIGTIYRLQNNVSEAMKLYREVLQIREGLHDEDGVGSVCENIGNVFSDRKQYDSALFYYNRALTIARQNNVLPSVASSLKNIAETYKDMKRPADAYATITEYLVVYDSLHNAEATNSINDLKMQYELDKQQQQSKFELEQKDKTLELERAQARIDAEHTSRNIILLIMGIVLALAAAGLLYFRARSRRQESELLSIKNEEITQQKKEITDSINYARRIQESIMPPEQDFKTLLPGCFIFYAPKDIVSGDFYWIAEREGLILFAAVDCTGHGVPGAMMSVVGFNLLEQAVNERGFTKPSDILRHLDWGVNKLLRQSEAGSVVKDGMDLALCSFNPKTLELQYAGAFNPLYHVRNGVLTELKADKSPIGVNTDGVVDDYTNHTLQLQKGDSIYIFSDGYADQFGGPFGKKFKYNQLREVLKKIYMLSPEEQRQRLDAAFVEWKRDIFQVDDVLLIGVKV